MGKMTCRRFVQYLLKMINLIFALIGLTMIGYGIYMIFSYNASSSSSLSSSSTVSLSAQSLISRPSDCNYLEYKIVDKNSNIRKCISQKCLDSCLFAWFWNDLPSAWFWYLFIIAGAVIIFITCSRYIAAATANGCCLSSYSFIVGILVVVEIAIVALIFYDSSWQDLMSDDSTGESDSIENFIAWKMKNFKQAALAVVFLQAFAMLLSVILPVVASSKTDSDDEHVAQRTTWQPLSNRQTNPTNTHRWSWCLNRVAG